MRRNEELMRVAEAVRDQCRHAAVCAPLHRLAPEDAVAGVNIESIVEMARDVPPDPHGMWAAALDAYDTVHGGNYDTVHDLAPRAAFERALTGASGHTDHLTAAVKRMAANETSLGAARTAHSGGFAHEMKCAECNGSESSPVETDALTAFGYARKLLPNGDVVHVPADAPSDTVTVVRDCAKLGHRYATRQTTGEETCIDCFGVAPAAPTTGALSEVEEG